MTGLEDSRQAICGFFMTRLWPVCVSGSGLVVTAPCSHSGSLIVLSRPLGGIFIKGYPYDTLSKISVGFS